MFLIPILQSVMSNFAAECDGNYTCSLLPDVLSSNLTDVYLKLMSVCEQHPVTVSVVIRYQLPSRSYFSLHVFALFACLEKMDQMAHDNWTWLDLDACLSGIS